MGKKLVKTAKARGHRVTWVECPKDAETARDLEKKLKRELPTHDALVMAAAVCDVRPKKVLADKIKRTALGRIEVVPNPDILANLAKRKKKGQIFIGFGLESKNVLKSGAEKMKKKSLDAILVQKATSKETPFGDKSINAFLLRRDEARVAIKNQPKRKIAVLIVQEVERLAQISK